MKQWQVEQGSAKHKPRPWKHEKFRLTREEQWQTTRQDSIKAAISYPQNRGVGTDAFQPRAFLDLGDERCPEGCGICTCCAGHRRVANNVELYPVFFLLPTTAGSGEPIALLARQIR